MLLVWLGLLVRAHVFVALHAARFPIADDVAIWGLTPPLGDFSWGSLWALHNEHRVPLPRLVLHGLYRVTGDLRSGMYLELELLGAIALAMLLAARRLRGRSSFADLFFPLVWLHTGNAENLLSSWQLVETLPVALVCLLLLAATHSARPPGRARMLACAGAALCLPLCGGVGIVQLPAWVAWLAAAARSGWRSLDPGEQRASRIGIGALGLLALVGAGYLVGFKHPGHVYTTSAAEILPTGGALLALSIGPAAAAWWPGSCVFVLLALVASAWLLATRLRRDPSERLRAAGLLSALAALLCLVLVIAVARGSSGWRAGFADRYVSLTAPLLCGAYFAWLLYGSRSVCAALALAAAAAWPLNERHGEEYGQRRHELAQRFEALAHARAPVGEIVAHYSRTFVVAPEIARALLKLFAEQGRPPFDAACAPAATAFEFPALRPYPVRIESQSPTRNTLVGDDAVLLVEAPCRIHLPLRAEQRALRGSFGIPDLLIESRRSRPLRFVIELLPEGGPPVTLLERVLDANTLEADRTPQRFDLELPEHAAGEVVLRAEPVNDSDAGLRWTTWSAVELR